MGDFKYWTSLWGVGLIIFLFYLILDFGLVVFAFYSSKYMSGQFSELERKSIEPIGLNIKGDNVRAM
jgi:hypothetical protein